MAENCAFLSHPLLERCGIEHGFGTRGASEPEGLHRPQQVHGTAVIRAPETGEADAIVSTHPGVRVGVITADCVPVLVANRNGTGVAAIHAGWRGATSGVIPRAVEELERSVGGGVQSADFVAVVGPHIGVCCYEVDEPVVRALAARPRGVPPGVLRPAGASHWMLDLGLLVRGDLIATGISPPSVGRFSGVCTRCDALRFHSFRRDGPKSGRLVHFLAARA